MGAKMIFQIKISLLLTKIDSNERMKNRPIK